MSVRYRERRDGSAYWQVRFRENGRECSVSWNSENEARKHDALIRQVGSVRAREILALASSPLSEMPLREWLDKFNDSLTGIEPGTINRYKAYVRRDIGPALGDMPITVLSRDDIAAWLNKLAEKNASGKTIKNKRDYLSGALKAAAKEGLIKANPCEGVRAPRWDREEMCFLTHDEFNLLLERVPTYWQPLVVTLAGYFLGGIPLVRDNLEAAILLIVVLSVLPMVFEYLRHRRSAAVRAREVTDEAVDAVDDAEPR